MGRVGNMDIHPRLILRFGSIAVDAFQCSCLFEHDDVWIRTQYAVLIEHSIGECIPVREEVAVIFLVRVGVVFHDRQEPSRIDAHEVRVIAEISEVIHSETFLRARVRTHIGKSQATLRWKTAQW